MRIATPVVACMLVFAACGGEGGGDAQAFCEVLTEDSDKAPSIDTPEGQAMLEEFRDAAPGELRGAIDTMVRKIAEFEELEASGSDDIEAFGEAFAMLLDPEFLAAMSQIEQWGVENCGLEEGWFADEGGTGFDEPATTEVPEGDRGGPDLGGGSDFDYGGDPEENWADLDDLQAWVESNYGDSSWAGEIFSWSTSPGHITVSGDLDPTSALEACEALAEYAEGQAMEVDVEVTDTEMQALVTGPGGDCAEV